MMNIHRFPPLAVACLFCLVVVTFVAPRASAQVSITFGAARGSAALHCSECATESRPGVSGHVHVLAPLVSGVRAGLEVSHFSRSETHGLDETNDTMTSGLVVAQWSPFRGSGFYLSGGAGYSSFVGEYGTPSQHVRYHDDVRGLSGQGAVGYEYGLTSHIAVGGFASYVRTLQGNVISTQRFVSLPAHANVSLRQLGLSLSWR
jgi:hypothetical protein